MAKLYLKKSSHDIPEGYVLYKVAGDINMAKMEVYDSFHEEKIYGVVKNTTVYLYRKARHGG